MKPATNQRRDQRVSAQIPVFLVRARTELPLVTSDVSYRGVFVEAIDVDAVRALLKLRVELPAGGFTAHAMVVHVAEGEAGRVGMGLQFWALSGSERKSWEDFVRSTLEARRAALRIVTPASPLSVGPESGVSGIRRVGDVAHATSDATADQRERR